MSEEDETISKVYVFWRHVLECDMCRILRPCRFSLVFDAPDHLRCPRIHLDDVHDDDARSHSAAAWLIAYHHPETVSKKLDSLD